MLVRLSGLVYLPRVHHCRGATIVLGGAPASAIQFLYRSFLHQLLILTLFSVPVGPVSLLQVREGLVGFDEAHCPFGSQCFRKFTKLKSRAVLRVIRAGYSVLWTDVDIVWFKDPLPHLLSFGPGTFPVQSNEPKSNLPGTGIRRINSGFYLARADQQTVEAFEAITAHAATTKLSEQPSFYDILCGPKGERVVKGKEMCVWENGLKTVFLSRAMYPNGAVYDLWDKPDVTQASINRGAAILHNNWILGRDAKMERFTKNGFWHYDATRRLCIWPWHSNLPRVIPLSTDENSKMDERR